MDMLSKRDKTPCHTEPSSWTDGQMDDMRSQDLEEHSTLKVDYLPQAIQNSSNLIQRVSQRPSMQLKINFKSCSQRASKNQVVQRSGDERRVITRGPWMMRLMQSLLEVTEERTGNKWRCRIRTEVTCLGRVRPGALIGLENGLKSISPVLGLRIWMCKAF